MAVRVDLWNNALGHIAQDVILAGPDDPSPEGRACRRFYPQARSVIFAEHPWRFANRTAQLAAITPTPPGSLFSYPVPSGYTEIRKVSETDRPEDLGMFWRLAGITDTAGNDLTVIRTDREAGFCDYQRIIEAEAIYPDLFARALEFLLASDLAGTFTREIAKRAELFEKYEMWLEKAKAADGRQSKDQIGETQIISRRDDAIEVLTVTGGAGIISGRA